MRRILLLCAALALSPTAANAQDDLLTAMMSLAAASPGSRLYGDMKFGSLVDIRDGASGATADIFSPGPTKCSLLQTALLQQPGDWAQLSVTTLDFSAITGARWLSPADDFDTAPSRQPDDPTIDGLMLDGIWRCQRVTHVDPAKPYFATTCDKSWYITLTDEPTRKAARQMLDLVGKACFPK